MITEERFAVCRSLLGLCWLSILGRWVHWLFWASRDVWVYALISFCLHSFPGWCRKGSRSLHHSISFSITVTVLECPVFYKIPKQACPEEEVHKDHGSIIHKHSTKGRGWMFGIIQFLFRHLMKYFHERSAQMLPENFIHVKGMKVSYHVTCEHCHPSQVLSQVSQRKGREGRSRQAWFLVISDTPCILLLNLFQYKLPYSGLTKQLWLRCIQEKFPWQHSGSLTSACDVWS